MIKLQNLCFPSREICSVKELYYHETEGLLRLDGFFNLLYLEKRKKYTKVHRLVLKLRAPGYSGLSVCCDRKTVLHYELDPADPAERKYELPYQDLEGNVLFFVLEKAKTPSGRDSAEQGAPAFPEGAIYADLPEEDLLPVNIGVDICTYRRETYVARNIKKLHGLISESQEEAGRHVRVYVIDNGRTLDTETADPRIRIIPNKNTGGAGGFTRGMLEILDEKERYSLTHVLLMDDDAVLDPETVVRLYGFLSTLKEEWKSVTVGGALMDENVPKNMIAFGEWWKDGRYQHTLFSLDVSLFKNAASKCLTEAAHEHDRYSGWWCCCWSLNTVTDKNLPLPVFIRSDDVEYGQRNRMQGCVFLNGIGVWHNGFNRVFEGVNSYYYTRNGLINFACHDSGNPFIALRFSLWNILGAAARFRICDARLAYRGLADFLKGPVWLYRQEPERLNAFLRKQVMQLHPWEELQAELTEEEYQKLTAELEVFRRVEAGGEDPYRQRWIPRSLKHVLTLNGLLLKGDPGASLFFPMDSIYRNYRKKKVVLCEPGSGKCTLVHRSGRIICETVSLALRAVIGMREQYPKAAGQWKQSYGKLITRKAWEEYLNR